MKKRALILSLAALAVTAAAGYGVRVWQLSAGYDDTGLPIPGAAATYILVAVAAVSLGVFIALAVTSPGRSRMRDAVYVPPVLGVVSIISSAAILCGACMEFAAKLADGSAVYDPIIAILGIAAGFCCLAVSIQRMRHSKPIPGLELVPIVYLLVKLALNFKSWSADPIILDYCFTLFALIFTLLLFYHSAGFAFDRGKPRRALLCAMGTVLFCAIGIAGRSMEILLSYGGFLLWGLVMAICLSRPAAEVPLQAVEETKAQ